MYIRTVVDQRYSVFVAIFPKSKMKGSRKICTLIRTVPRNLTLPMLYHAPDLTYTTSE